MYKYKFWQYRPTPRPVYTVPVLQPITDNVHLLCTYSTLYLALSCSNFIKQRQDNGLCGSSCHG